VVERILWKGRRVTLTVGLILASTSPAKADSVRCRTRYDEAFKRWMTECTDGARAVTRYDEHLKRYETDVVTPPQGDKPPQGWPKSEQRPR
jgi:hypothetical protein